MRTFTDAELCLLRTQARMITSIEARDLVGLNDRQWRVRRVLPQFPKLQRHGRHWLLKARELAAYIDWEQRARRGYSFKAVTGLVHLTAPTLRRKIAAGEFPKTIGVWAGVERFDRAEVDNWLRAQEWLAWAPPQPP